MLQQVAAQMELRKLVQAQKQGQLHGMHLPNEAEASYEKPWLSKAFSLVDAFEPLRRISAVGIVLSPRSPGQEDAVQEDAPAAEAV